MAWYGLGRAFVEGLRTDSLYWGSFRVSQMLAAVSCVIAVVVLLVMSFRKHSPENLLVNQVAARAEAEAAAAAEAAEAEPSEAEAVEAEDTAGLSQICRNPDPPRIRVFWMITRRRCSTRNAQSGELGVESGDFLSLRGGLKDRRGNLI